MILKLMYIIYSKSAEITLSVCVAVGKFVCDVNGGKPVLSFFVYAKARGPWTCIFQWQGDSHGHNSEHLASSLVG